MIIRDTAVADRLNKLNNSSFCCDCGLNHRLPVTFLGGNYLNAIKLALKDNLPYGKVALIANEKDYLEFAKPVQKAVRSIGCKLVGLTFDGETDSVDGASELFNLPEDVRAVIVFGEDIFNACAYYATVRDILLIAVPTALNVSYALSVAATFNNGKVVDRVNVCASRYVIIDENIADADTIPEAYAFIMSKLTAITDYRFYTGAYNIEPCKYAYGLAKKAVISTFGIINVQPCSIAATLMEYSAYLGMANAVTGGALYDFYGAGVAARLYGADDRGGVELYTSIKVAGVYDLFLNGKVGDLLKVPDYNERAEFFAQKYPFPERQEVKSLIAQIRAIRRGEKKLNAVIKAVKAEVGANVEFIDNIMKIYVALGGKVPEIDLAAFKLALKHGGDAPYYLNGLSIARSKGLLEYLN